MNEEKMEGEHEERREEEEEDRTLTTPSRRGEEEDEEEEEEIEMTKATDFKDKVQRELIGGHTPISASSSFTSSPFLSSSLRRGRGGGGGGVIRDDAEEDEVRVAIVTIEDESCPSEPFGTAQIETANQITRTEGGGDEEEKGEVGEEMKEEEEEREEANSNEREEEEDEEVMSRPWHPLSQVRPFPCSPSFCHRHRVSVGVMSPVYHVAEDCGKESEQTCLIEVRSVQPNQQK